MARRALLVAGLAVAGAQAGHLLAYQVRFGPAAMRVKPGGATFISLLAALFTMQLAWFAEQEVIEALAAGLPPASASDLVLWGMVGRLPVAFVGAAALRCLWTSVESAASELAAIARVTLPAPRPAPPSWSPSWWSPAS